MNGSKLMRYVVYFLLAIIVIWILNDVLTSYHLIKADMAEDDFKEDQKRDLLKRKDDSIFYTMINQLIKSKKYNDVIIKLNERKKLYPQEDQFYTIDIGDVYAHQGDYVSAIQQYSNAIKISGGSNVNAYTKRGQLEFRLNRLDAAINDYKAAANENFYYYLYLGELLEKKANFKEASSSYDSCLKYDPENIQCKLRLDSLKLNRNNNLSLSFNLTGSTLYFCIPRKNLYFCRCLYID